MKIKNGTTCHFQMFLVRERPQKRYAKSAVGLLLFLDDEKFPKCEAKRAAKGWAFRMENKKK